MGQRLAVSRRSGDLPADQAAWLDAVIDSATQLSAEVARLELARAGARTAMDAITTGIVVLDGYGRVLRANARAERLLAPNAQRTRTRRAGRTAPAGGRLRLPGAAIEAVRTSPTTSGLVTLERPGLSSVELLAVRLGDGDHGRLADARTVLFVVDPSDADGLEEADLEVAFDLTPAEARLAARLVAGDTVQAAGRALGIRITTARTHLSRIFLKTGTTRQPELMRVLLAVPRVARRLR